MMLEACGETVDGSKVNANHDMLPEQGRRLAESSGLLVIHNGDYQIYKEVFA